MALAKVGTRAPAGIGGITITLKDVPTQAGRVGWQGVSYMVEVTDALGAMVTVQQGDLSPELTAEQVKTLQAFMAAMRAKATDELLEQ